MESEGASLAAADDRLPTAEDQAPADDLAANEDLAADEDIAVAENRWSSRYCQTYKSYYLQCMRRCKPRKSKRWCLRKSSRKGGCLGDYRSKKSACGY